MEMRITTIRHPSKSAARRALAVKHVLFLILTLIVVLLDWIDHYFTNSGASLNVNCQ